MRTSLFEILRPRLEGARVVDCFAGTGSLGFEALSRGAAHALFLDADLRCVEVLERNAVHLGFAGRVEVRRADAFLEAPRLEASDLAFVDPPYAFHAERAAEVAALVGTLLARAALVVVEYDRRRPPPPLPGEAVDERRYGDTVVRLLRPA
jgi:16S rRNA (guanine966-N2)-methyltransferase